jgi:hypothetical protein
VWEQLPRLLDRNFLIGYFIPIVGFLGTTLGVLAPLRGAQHVINGIQRDPGMGLLYAVLLSVILAYILVAANRPFIRLLEGYYGPFTWIRSFVTTKRAQYDMLNKEVQTLRAERNSIQDNLASAKITDPQTKADLDEKLAVMNKKLYRKWAKLVTYFPHSGEFVLPTRFGNVFRSLETYSTTMYGLDSIPLWRRLNQIMEQTSQDELASEKAMIDFYVNLFYLAICFIVVICIRMVHDFAAWQPLTMLGVGFLAWGFYECAIRAALQCGEQVKASFDIYVHDLARRLGYEPPLSRSGWEKVSQAFTFNVPLPSKAEAEMMTPGAPSPCSNVPGKPEQ